MMSFVPLQTSSRNAPCPFYGFINIVQQVISLPHQLPPLLSNQTSQNQSSIAIMSTSKAQFKVCPARYILRHRVLNSSLAQIGDFVEYRPIGGAHDNVSHSKGEIVNVSEVEDGVIRYAIRNENTGKTTNYQVCILSGRRVLPSRLMYCAL